MQILTNSLGSIYLGTQYKRLIHQKAYHRSEAGLPVLRHCELPAAEEEVLSSRELQSILNVTPLPPPSVSVNHTYC